MTPERIREIAEELILDHARDIEFLTIVEHLAYNLDAELPEAEQDEAARQIDALIRKATVTVEFPEHPDPAGSAP